MTPFLGQIQAFGFNFAPRGWAFCNGQILSIAQNTALFSLLGTTYGGDGQVTFALPDLRGRSIVHPGQGPGLSSISQGEVSGLENVTLLITNLPAHNHTAVVQLGAGIGNSDIGTNNNFAVNAVSDTIYNAGAFSGTMAAGNVSVGISGSNQPVGIRNPYLGIYVCIALEGIYPSRN